VGSVVLHRLAGAKKAYDACRLVEALYLDGRRVVVWFSDAGRAAVLDQYLWTFSQSSFVPHLRWNGGDELEEPVALVVGELANPNRADVLVVVDRLEELGAAAQFERIHDLLARTSEDHGKREAWEAAGFSVQEVQGVAARRKTGTQRAGR
jgi:DNA polymerase IIIc chi subunit